MRTGRPPTYPLRGMAVGDCVHLPAPTPADVKRVHRNISIYGRRHQQTFRGVLDRDQGTIAVTRHA